MKKLSVFVACLFVIAAMFHVGDASATITISNVQESFDPLTCTVTISWDTSDCTDDNAVKWDTVPCASATFPNTASENAGCGKSHSVTFDVSAAAGPGHKISYIIESSNDCDSGSTSCDLVALNYCIGG